MQTEAQKRAEKKWNNEKVDSLHIRVRKGMRKSLQEHAKSKNETLNGFVNRAILETIKRDNDIKDMIADVF